MGIGELARVKDLNGLSKWNATNEKKISGCSWNERNGSFRKCLSVCIWSLCNGDLLLSCEWRSWTGTEKVHLVGLYQAHYRHREASRRIHLLVFSVKITSFVKHEDSVPLQLGCVQQRERKTERAIRLGSSGKSDQNSFFIRCIELRRKSIWR